MKKEYDFSKGKKGAIDKSSPGKVRITIRLDNEVIDWFRSQVEAKGRGNYQTMINDALKEYVKNPEKIIQDTVRKVIEEILRPSPTISLSGETAVTDQIRHLNMLPIEEWSATAAGMTEH